MESENRSGVGTIDRPMDRRGFLTRAGVAGLGLAAAAILPGCGGSNGTSATPNQGQSLLNAAATAEALATTMYWNLIHSPLYTAGLSGIASDQSYLQAAFEQELIHYNALVSLGAQPLTTTFFFPPNMFGSGMANFQLAINTLVTLEDAFIAAYLIAIRDFSSNASKVIAGQILGIETEHRALARDIASDLGLPSTTGLSGHAELISPPSHAVNNLAFERTFGSILPNIAAVVGALGPFVNSATANYVAPPIAFAAASVGSGAVTLDNSGLTS